MCPTLNFTSLVYVFVFIFLWRVLILGQLWGFMWQGRESLRSARIRAMPAHSSRTSDGLKGTVIIRTRVGEATIARKKSFFSGAALKYFQKTIPLIPKQNKVINGLAIGSMFFFLFTHMLACSYAPGYFISHMMRFKNCPHQMRKQMGRGLARISRKAPRMPA